MTTIRKFLPALAALLLLSGLQNLSAQGTAFTYQGQFATNGSAFTGTEDMLFTLYDYNSSAVVGTPITNAATGITNGLFLVTLDFGTNSFTNILRMLEIAVRPVGSTNGFTTLSPRQVLTPTPQAIFAGTAAGVVNGAITAASLSPGVGTSGQVLKMSGSALVWGTDLNSGGTITNLATGLGLTGGPVTLNGTLAIDTNVVPQLGVTNVFSAGQTIQSGSAARPALVLGGSAAQTANLQEWRSNSGATLASVDASGTFNGNGNGLTNVNGNTFVSGSVYAVSIATNQVVKNLNGLMDSVALAPGNNMLLTTNANTLTFNTAPGLLSWFVIPGTATNAQPNKGYLLTNSALATVTLPATPALADIVRVSGISTNGWMVAQNSGQSILMKNLPGNIGVTWTARDSGHAWSAIASSADGSKLVAAVSNSFLYTSVDYGSNWIARGISSSWIAVASSSDGTNLVAAVNGGFIYTSGDSGITWTARASANNWYSVASSSSGETLVAAITNNLNYISTDYGVTWTGSSGAAGGKLAISADGSTIVDVLTNGTVYTSVNTGGNWTTNNVSLKLNSVAASSDCSKLVAAVSGGAIYTSTDFGAHWTAHDSNRTWVAVASSTDGTKLAATVSNGQIYTSVDSGTTWYAHATNRVWSAITSSADGSRLAATVSGGQIYTSDTLAPVTTTGAAGYLLGQPYSAVELQYIGNNQFMPISHEGFITGN